MGGFQLFSDPTGWLQQNLDEQETPDAGTEFFTQIQQETPAMESALKAYQESLAAREKEEAESPATKFYTSALGKTRKDYGKEALDEYMEAMYGSTKPSLKSGLGEFSKAYWAAVRGTPYTSPTERALTAGEERYEKGTEAARQFFTSAERTKELRDRQQGKLLTEARLQEEQRRRQRADAAMIEYRKTTNQIRSELAGKQITQAQAQAQYYQAQAKLAEARAEIVSQSGGLTGESAAALWASRLPEDQQAEFLTTFSAMQKAKQRPVQPRVYGPSYGEPMIGADGTYGAFNRRSGQIESFGKLPTWLQSGGEEPPTEPAGGEFLNQHPLIDAQGQQISVQVPQGFQMPTVGGQKYGVVNQRPEGAFLVQTALQTSNPGLLRIAEGYTPGSQPFIQSLKDLRSSGKLTPGEEQSMLRNGRMGYFMMRMAQMMPNVMKQEAEGPSNFGPMAGRVSEGKAIYFPHQLSKEMRTFVTSLGQLTNAVLRQESGAAIPQWEWDNIARLLPQLTLGDEMAWSNFIELAQSMDRYKDLKSRSNPRLNIWGLPIGFSFVNAAGGIDEPWLREKKVAPGQAGPSAAPGQPRRAPITEDTIINLLPK